jgi:hypothetical protein
MRWEEYTINLHRAAILLLAHQHRERLTGLSVLDQCILLHELVLTWDYVIFDVSAGTEGAAVKKRTNGQMNLKGIAPDHVSFSERYADVLAPNSLVYRMKLLNQLMERRFQQMLEPFQLTPLHWAVLCCLWQRLLLMEERVIRSKFVWMEESSQSSTSTQASEILSYIQWRSSKRAIGSHSLESNGHKCN